MRWPRCLFIACGCASLVATGCGGTTILFVPMASPSVAPRAEAEVTALGDADLRARGLGKVGYVFVTMTSA